MKKIFILLAVFSTILYPDIANIDEPEKGLWDLKIEKVFDIRNYGKNTIAMPKIETINDEGIVVVYDYKLRENFLFTQDGKYLTSFGKRGEGPGEIKRQRRVFSVLENFIVSDFPKLHYFSNKGKYIRSVPIKRSFGSPAQFINENEFISYRNEKRFSVNRVDLIKMEKKTVVEESPVQEEIHISEGSKFRIVVVIPPLTPKTFFAYDPKTKVSYFGRNDKYAFRVMDNSGKIINTFSISNRKKIKLTKQMKKKINKEMHLSKKMWKKFPKELTYFNDIKIVNDLLYVFVTNFDEYYKEQQIDVFSLKGKYLYKIIVKLESNVLMNGHLHIGKDFIYAIIQKDNGDMKITKYKVNLPTD